MIKQIYVSHWTHALAGHPKEDAHSFNPLTSFLEDIIAVADGITRDPCLYLPDTKTLLGKIQFELEYHKHQRPSYAGRAAAIACKTIIDNLSNSCKTDEELLKKSMIEANNSINKYNQRVIKNPDYLMNDFAGCVAAAAVRLDDSVFWSFIADCGISIFNHNGRKLYETEDEGPSKYSAYIEQAWQDMNWRDSKDRSKFRKSFRNNTKEPRSFGVLTGEKAAENYVRAGKYPFSRGDFLLVYTDGLKQAIDSPEFSKLLAQGNIKSIEKLCKSKVRTEGTIIISYNNA